MGLIILNFVNKSSTLLSFTEQTTYDIRLELC